MDKKSYKKIADMHKAEENRVGNAITAFVVGGIVGLLGEAIIEGLCCISHISMTDASTYMIIIMIFVASLSTALGFFDKLVTKFKAGLLIPITGFAHSMTSAALDYRKEGPIYGLGSNIFKLAGSVILYGIISAFLLTIVKVVFYG